MDEIEPQLVGELTVANDEAKKTFTEIPDCTYASKALGDQVYFDDDTATCDCGYDRGFEMSEQACGEDANCVNRLLQIECIQGDCKCGKWCQNQRFNKKQYAPIDIVQTEKKGFGVRARENILADTFVYEYIGEVIGPSALQRKLKEYGNDGIRHFYFMALDKEVFIDATKKGGIGRFLNHSCNPNCFVAKWTVGNKMRMGIFTKRDIKKDEELTFNYNVDRYGHTAQECYCGEANCVGFIGGKTQTDIGGMDELYIDALGITEEVEALGLRGTKKKKGKKLDEDFVPTLKPIDIDEVPKVCAAVRQAITNRRILEKLLSRIQMTPDEEVQRQLLRLKGFNLMSHILKEYPSDFPIITLVLQVLSKWPLLARNKVESCKIEDSVKKCVEMETEPIIVELSQNLLTTWSELKLEYRIPKAEGDRKRVAEMSIEHIAKRARQESPRPVDEPLRPIFIKPLATISRLSVGPPLPPNWREAFVENSAKPYYYNSVTKETQWEVPKVIVKVEVGPVVTKPVFKGEEYIAEIIAKEDARVKAEEEEKKRLEEEEEKRKLRVKKKGEGNKDKKVMALFSTIVVQVMSKYKSHLDQDQFKKRARELTQILCEKEKKHPNYSNEPYDKLTPDKASKIKAFTKDWVRKLIERNRKSSSSSSRSSSTFSSTTTATTSSLPTTESQAAQDDADLIASMVDGVGGDGDGDEDEGTPPREMKKEEEGGGGETPPGTPPSKRREGTPPPPPPPKKAEMEVA